MEYENEKIIESIRTESKRIGFGKLLIELDVNAGEPIRLTIETVKSIKIK